MGTYCTTKFQQQKNYKNFVIYFFSEISKKIQKFREKLLKFQKNTEISWKNFWLYFFLEISKKLQKILEKTFGCIFSWKLKKIQNFLEEHLKFQKKYRNCLKKLLTVFFSWNFKKITKISWKNFWMYFLLKFPKKKNTKISRTTFSCIFRKKSSSYGITKYISQFPSTYHIC